jgi:hypothetical protein
MSEFGGLEDLEGTPMGYRIRILGTNPITAPLRDLERAAEPAIFEGDEGVGDEWEALILKHKAGNPIAVIERNPVVPGELGASELQEFIDDVSHYRPASAAAWLRKYLPTVKVIYAFQLLSGTEVDNGFELMQRVYGVLWRYAGGILQADQEGFSDESGYSILWQFSEAVRGEWNVGVLAPDGHWVHFEMDLGNQEHREAFWRGEVPDTVKLILEN